MKSSDYRSPVCLQLTIKTLLLATTIVILLPAVVTSVPSTDGRRRQQLQQQHHQQQQQQPKRHVTFIINEDSPVGTVIGHIDQMTPQAAAESAGKAVARYVMLSGDLGDERPIRKQRPQTSPASELFAIDAATGVLTTRRVLNLESICPPSLFPGRQQQSAVVEDDNSCAVVFGVAVRQNAPSVVPNSIVAVTILVNDVNNKVPSFFHGRASGDKGKDHVTVARDVPESAPINEPVFRLPVARDADFNRKSNGRIAGYRLEPEDGPFTLQLATPGDGGDEDELTVALKSSLDREQTDQYNLTLIAYDAGVPPLTGTLYIRVTVTDVNDNRPHFDQPNGYEATLAAGAPVGTSVVKVTASDPDLGDSGIVRYSFAPRTQARFGGMFSIHSVSGEIVTSGPVSFGFPSPTIGLVVLAADQGPNSEPSSTTVTIRAAEINQHAPEITFADSSDPRRLSITENFPAGSFIGHVVVRDPDVGRAGQVECIVSGGDGQSYAAADDNFRLVPLYTSEYRLVTGRSFDREVREQYDFAIQCRDLGRPSMTSSLSVSVNIADVDDNKPTFPVDEYRFTVAENNERGQLIGRVVATDSDLVTTSRSSAGGIIYSLADPDGDAAAWFSIDATSGAITAKVPFDREFVDQFEFTVIANSTPTIGVSHSTSGSDSSNATTARVRVRVSVLDVDDEPPRFTRSWYRFEVAENMSSGAEVGRVEAFDEDQPPFNSFFYQLETSSMSDADDNGEMAGDSDDDDNYDDNNDDDDDVSGSYFAIDPTTGIIFTRRSLDRESLSHFAIRIRAQSDVAAATPTAAAASGHSSSSSFSDAAVVFIRVTDVNDNAPEVTYPTASDNTVNVPRASEVRVGDVVATVSARDRDSGANARLTYSIVGGNDERRFEIGQTTGTVRWRRDFLSNADPVEDRTLGLSNDTTFSLIRSSSSSCPWTLKILVQDSGTPTRLSTTTQLNVVVDDLAQCRGSSVSAIVVNPPPDGASLRRSEPAPLDPSTAAAGSADRDRRHHQSALTATGQPLFGGLTDWHVFVILVALAACVIVVGGLLTAAVVLRRGCSSSGRSRRRSGSTSANVAASELDCCPAGKGDGGDVELKLLTSLNGMGPMADLATLSKAGGTLKGFGTATVVGRSVDGEPVLLVLDAEKLNGRVVLTVGEQQQLLEPHLSPNSVSRLRHPSYIETTLVRIPRDRDSDSGCGIDLSPVL